MKACPCDPALVSLLRAYPPIIASGIAFYPNPRTPSRAVMTVEGFRKTFCAACRKGLGLPEL